MANDRPMFSIVMPTRNRAHLLRYALQSALEQTFEDYEIVVSDNSSGDATPDVVREIGTSRVRYIRTERALPMHDSWEFALTQARGEWILYLCDDDALYPEALQTISSVIKTDQTELVCWLAGSYLMDSPFISPERRGQVVLLRCTGKHIRISSSSQLDSLFRMRFNPLMLPKMLNSCCHRTLIERVKQRVGRFFLPPFPDYTSCTAMLAMTKTYIFIDRPLFLAGGGAHVPGVTAERGKPTRHLDFSNDFQGQMFDCVPLTHETGSNGTAECLLKVQNAMETELSGLKLDRCAYFANCYKEMVGMENDGHDVSDMRKEFFGVLARESLSVRARVWTSKLAPRMPILFRRGMVRRAIISTGVLRLLDATVRRRKWKVIGWDGGFSNIIEAVRHTSRIGQNYSNAR